MTTRTNTSRCWLPGPAITMLFLAAFGIGAAAPVGAQETRDDQHAAQQAEKAQEIHPYVPTPFERRVIAAERFLVPPRGVYAFIGSVFPGGLLAGGPGYRSRFAESGVFDAHA